MLDGLWIATAAPAVEAALAAMAARGPIAVVDAPRLARALTARGRAVTALGAADVAAGAPRFTTLIGVGAGARAPYRPDRRAINRCAGTGSAGPRGAASPS